MIIIIMMMIMIMIMMMMMMTMMMMMVVMMMMMMMMMIIKISLKHNQRHQKLSKKDQTKINKNREIPGPGALGPTCAPNTHG